MSLYTQDERPVATADAALEATLAATTAVSAAALDAQGEAVALASAAGLVLAQSLARAPNEGARRGLIELFNASMAAHANALQAIASDGIGDA